MSRRLGEAVHFLVVPVPGDAKSPPLMKPQVALQLYTVRDLIAKTNYADIVKEIAAMGYAGVEPAGFPGTTPQAAAKLFRDLGLIVCGIHSPPPIGEKKTEVLDTAAVLGCQRLVTGKGPADFKTRDLIHKSCEEFNRASQAARENGLTLSIHNHWWEFQSVDGRPVYEWLLEDLDKQVLFEIDVYWVKTGGCDPAKVVKQLAARSPLQHIKDGPCRQGEPMTAVGDGTVDFPAIAKVSKAEWWIVELDECATEMMEAVRKSYRYLTTKGFVRGKKN